jgi:CshA-type fibril repeat protein
MTGAPRPRPAVVGNILFNQSDPVFGDGPVAGDQRANENIALTAMQALFAREHNRWVDVIEAESAAQGLGLSTQQVFDAARARNEAVMQAITFNEFLPILLGENAFADYDGFKSDVNPAILLEFSTAIYRLGHSQLSPTIRRMNEDGSEHPLGDVALRDAFQQRGEVDRTGPEAILRGMATSFSQELDTFVIEDVRSFLFGGNNGRDLAALNIQRGRDHGLPSYMQMRAGLGLDELTDFSQITSDAQVVQRLRDAYDDDLSKIDLWVGGLAEDPVAGGMVGETFRRVMVEQFTRLRDGDPRWSQGRGFNPDELKALWSTTLADVLKRNSTPGERAVVDIQDDVLLAYDRIAGTGGDDTLDGVDGQRNLLIGLGGNDTLTGRGVGDHLSGGDGDDTLVANGGRNTLVGGTGDDTFRFDAAASSDNVIKDWQAGEAIEFVNAAGVAPMTVTDGTDGAVIVFGGATVLVKGVTAAQLGLVDAPPAVGDDVATGPANAALTIAVLGNDFDPDGLDPSSVEIAGAGDGGKRLEVAGEGVWQVNADGTITFTPEAGFGGAATTIFYTVADTEGLRSAQARVSVTVTVENQPPVAAADSATAPVNGSASVAVLANDGDDNGQIDPTSVRLEGADAGSGGLVRTVAGEGVFTVSAATGAITFAPIANFAGSPTVQGYTVADAQGLRSNVAALAITMTGGVVPGLTLTGNGNANTQNGGAGHDTLNGNGGNDTQNGAGGNDVLNGGSGNDQTNGGDGNDVVLISGNQAQADTINGGDGLADTIRVIASGGDVVLNGTGAISNVEIWEGSNQRVVGTSGNNTLDFSIFAAVVGIASINGQRGRDTITGTAGDDVLIGGAGADTLNGLGGDDTLTGGSAVDVVDGGDGDDVIFIRTDAAVTDTMSGGAGFDRIRLDNAAADVVLAGTGRISGVESLELSGRSLLGTGAADLFDLRIFDTVTGVASVRGAGGDDTIIGTAGNDVVFGDAGADVIEGLGGDDTFTGGSENDTFRFVAGTTSGVKTITDFDAAGDDVLLFVGFGFGSPDPGSLTDAERRAAVGAATTFDGDADGGATIDLAGLGGAGGVRLIGVTAATLTFTAEDVIFG